MASTLNEIVTHIKQQIPHIDCETAAQRRKTDHGLLIDVREPSEHSAQNTPEAINIPRGFISTNIPSLCQCCTRRLKCRTVKAYRL